MRRRPYGTTGMELSLIGFGGILVMNETAGEAGRLVGKAIDLGINYFDVAPNYGNAQEMLGPALAPYRKNVYLACKTQLRDAAGARQDLERSLELLKTDYFDIYQLHAVTSRQDVRQILGSDGALETIIKAKEQGLIHHIGFSAHSEEAALALMEAYPFESVLFPLNWATWYGGDFGKKVVSAALEKGISLLALKALAKRKLEKDEKTPWNKSWYCPVETYEEAKTGLRFTLELPVTAAVSPGHEELFDWAVKAESEYSPLHEEEKDALKKKALNTPLIFDAHHSEWDPPGAAGKEE